MNSSRSSATDTANSGVQPILEAKFLEKCMSDYDQAAQERQKCKPEWLKEWENEQQLKDETLAERDEPK